MVEKKAKINENFGSEHCINILGREPKDVTHMRVDLEPDYMILVDKSRLSLVEDLIVILNKNYKYLISKTNLPENKVVLHEFYEYTENPE